MNTKSYATLFVLFTLICLGMGYSVLNRVDVLKVPSLVDITVYRAMVRSEKPGRWKHMHYRVLVPYLARPIYQLSRGHVGSWDAAMLGLVVVDSLFTAATALLLLRLGWELARNYLVALIAALLYLLNFAVPNTRTIGFVDAAEGFFLLALAWALMQRRWLLVPLVFIGGALAKESFVVFAAVFGIVWWILENRREKGALTAGSWIVGGIGAALFTTSFVHWAVDRVIEFPWQFGAALNVSARSGSPTHYTAFNYLKHFLFVSVLDMNSLYIFCWLLPLSLFHLKELPSQWKRATAATVAAAFFLNSYYGGGPGTIGRALFSIAAPLLSLSAALWVTRLAQSPAPPPVPLPR